MPTFNELLADCLPRDHSLQFTAEDYLDRVFSEKQQIKHSLDLGCGNLTHSLPRFKQHDPSIQWVGLDVGTFADLSDDDRGQGVFLSYNGISMPFPAESFDLIYCRQVLEHVEEPRALLQEVKRILKPDGIFIGSTSHLEPYHAYSTFNYTPYGFLRLIEQVGLQLVEIRPSIDGLTLIVRRLLRQPAFFYRWWRVPSPLNRAIDVAGVVLHKDPAWINGVKLLFCGQFSFLIRKRRNED